MWRRTSNGSSGDLFDEAYGAGGGGHGGGRGNGFESLGEVNGAVVNGFDDSFTSPPPQLPNDAGIFNGSRPEPNAGGLPGGQQPITPGGGTQQPSLSGGANGAPIRTESGPPTGQPNVAGGTSQGGSVPTQGGPTTNQAGGQPGPQSSTQPSTTGGPRPDTSVTNRSGPSHMDSSGRVPNLMDAQVPAIDVPALADPAPRGPDTPPPDPGPAPNLMDEPTPKIDIPALADPTPRGGPTVDAPAPESGRPKPSIDTSFAHGEGPVSPLTEAYLNGMASGLVSPVGPATSPPNPGPAPDHPSGPQNSAPPRSDLSAAGAQQASIRSDGPPVGPNVDRAAQDRLSDLLNKPADRPFLDRMTDKPATQSSDRPASPDRPAPQSDRGPAPQPARPDRAVADAGPVASVSDRAVAKSPTPEDMAAAAMAVGYLHPDHHTTDHHGATPRDHTGPDGPGPDFVRPDGTWRERRNAAKPTRVSAERFVPFSRAGGLRTQNSQVTGEIQQIRFDVRHFEVAPGKWVLELTAPLDFVSPDGKVDAKGRQEFADELQRGFDTHMNFTHTWPEKGQFFGSQVHFTIEAATPNGITRGWDADPKLNLPVEVRDSSTMDPFTKATVPAVNQVQLDRAAPIESAMHEVFHGYGLGEGYHDPKLLFKPTVGLGGIMGKDHVADPRLTSEQLGLTASTVNGSSRPVLSHSLADNSVHTQPAANPAAPGELVHSVYADGPYSAQHSPPNAPNPRDPNPPPRGGGGNPSSTASSRRALGPDSNRFSFPRFGLGSLFPPGGSRSQETGHGQDIEMVELKRAETAQTGQSSGHGSTPLDETLADHTQALDDSHVWTGKEVRDQALQVRRLAEELEGLAKSGGKTPEELRSLANDLNRSADRLDKALQGDVKDTAQFGGTYALRNEYVPLVAVTRHLATLVDEAARAKKPGTQVALEFRNFLGTETSVAEVRRWLPSLVRRYRTNQAFAEVPTGEQWKAVIENLDKMSKTERIQFVRTLSERNIETLREDVDELLNGMPAEERSKFETLRDRLTNLPYRIKHATPAYHAIANSGLLSSQGDLARRDLKSLASGKSSVKNTSNLGNNDFVFFRMEVGDKAMATRYGPTTLIFDAKVLEDSGGWVSLHDQLLPLDRETMRELEHEGEIVRTAKYDPGFEALGKHARWTYRYPGNNNTSRKVSFDQEVFHGEHVREALVLSVVREVAQIGGGFKDYVLKLGSSELGPVITKLYRPEAKFGSGLPINPVGSSAQTEWPMPVTVVNENGDGRYLPDGTIDPVALDAGKRFDRAEDGWRQADKALRPKDIKFLLEQARSHAEASVKSTQEFYDAATGERKDMAKSLLDKRKKRLSDIKAWLTDPKPRSGPAEMATPGAGTGAPQMADLVMELPERVEAELSKALREGTDAMKPNATNAMKRVLRVLARSDGYRPLKGFKDGATQEAVGLGRNLADGAIKNLEAKGLVERTDGGLRLTRKGRDLVRPSKLETEPPALTTPTPSSVGPERNAPRFDRAAEVPDRVPYRTVRLDDPDVIRRVPRTHDDGHRARNIEGGKHDLRNRIDDGRSPMGDGLADPDSRYQPKDLKGIEDVADNHAAVPDTTHSAGGAHEPVGPRGLSGSDRPAMIGPDHSASIAPVDNPSGWSDPYEGRPRIGGENRDPDGNGIPVGERTLCADPVDVATGWMFLPQTDVEMGGSPSLRVKRVHRSGYRLGGWFGASWASTLDQRLEVDGDGTVHFAAEDGTLLSYPALPRSASVYPSAGPRWALTRLAEDGYAVTRDDEGVVLYFESVGRPDQFLLVEIADGHGRSIGVRYDDAGVIQAVEHSAGHAVEFFVVDGLVRELWSGSGDRLASYTYDDDRRLVAVGNSSDQDVRFDYDEFGRIVSWLDRNGVSYRYAYDADDRCVRTEGYGGQLNYTFDYDRSNRRTTVTDSMGGRTVYQLDERSRVVEQVDPLGATTSWEWDEAGRPLSFVDALGRVTSYTYDESGNRTSLVRPDGSVVLAFHDERDLLVRRVDPDGGQWMWEYTEDGLLAAEVDPLGRRWTYQYHADGLLASVTGPLGNTTDYEWSAEGNLAAVVDSLGNATAFRYDDFGSLSGVMDPLGRVTQMLWTVEGQPFEQVLPDGSVWAWRHDGEGNLVESTSGFGAVTRAVPGAFDLPVEQVEPDGARTTYTYDTELRLVAVTNDRGMVWRYEYDSAGRLVWESDYGIGKGREDRGS